MQLDRLRSVALLPNVRFGIIPLGAPLTITPQNSFSIYDSVAIVDTFITETIYSNEEFARYRRILALLWEQAAEGQKALALIDQASMHIRATQSA